MSPFCAARWALVPWRWRRRASARARSPRTARSCWCRWCPRRACRSCCGSSCRSCPTTCPSSGRIPRHSCGHGSARWGLSVLVAAPATWFWGAWGAVAWLLLPAQLLGAWFDWRFQGWLVTEALVVVRQGFWRRRTTVVQRSRIQSVRARQGPLERGYGIGHVRIDVAGSYVILPSVGWEEAQSLIDVLPARRPTRRSLPARLPG
ncbi:PH domain-containing protein [Corallococcus coralloides]|uniref:PH domain-containing protein n=1 Tax=Corallococcus coralloides TaxID=184914 RepID=UPI003B435D6A